MQRAAPFVTGVLCLALGSAPAAAPVPAGPADPDSTLGAVAGRIVAAGRPAAYAHALILGTRRGAMTDEAGRFRIGGVPPGPRQLVVQMLGFERRVVDVAVTAGAVESLAVDLGPELLTRLSHEVTPDTTARARVETAFCAAYRREEARWFERGSAVRRSTASHPGR